jgi:dynein heavy chain
MCACLQVAKALPVLCVKFHEDVQALSARFLAEQRRHYYVTPTSYLELLGSYKKLLAKRQDEVGGGVHSMLHAQNFTALG